ncbi:MAG: type I restriction endonuclease subunit R [Acidobacteria bacterium]|nr:type I restriction endonuclease subunit R [Acidobacteriota bacterium]
MAKLPEAAAREAIDAALIAAGWAVQDASAVNLHAGRGVAIRELPLKSGHGSADYLLYVDRRAAGVVEAKKAGATLTGVEPQTGKYSTGMPDHLPRASDPLPFLYQSTGVETRFTETSLTRSRPAASEATRGACPSMTSAPIAQSSSRYLSHPAPMAELW